MNLKAAIFGLAIAAFGINGCGGSGGGGGGGGATAAVTGTVVFIETGAAPNPQASVQVGGSSVLTDSTVGSFTVTVPVGTTTLTVNTNSSGGIWTFTIPAVPAAGEDVGDLWVGVNKVTLIGLVQDSASGAPIAGASVNFGGVTGMTNASGIYSLNPVAYPTTNFSPFWGILGNVTDPNYFANTVTASPNVAVGGVVTCATVLMTPLSSTTPPTSPYTIWGRITPLTLGAGCTVTLSKNGTVVRTTTADGTGTYYFWVLPGTYTLHFVNGTHVDASDPTVTVKATNDVERQDVTLN